VRDRAFEAATADDWPALRALTSADFVWEDRSRRALLTGDVERWIQSTMHVRRSWGAPPTRELIGTVGDWIALERLVFTGGPDTGAVEIAFILLTEINADGKLRASLMFDGDACREAFAEAEARFVAGEAAAIGGQAPIAALEGAFLQHDHWESVRGCLAAELVLVDHRVLGLGPLRRDELVEAWRAQRELAPDLQPGTRRILTWNCHGRVEMQTVVGTMPEGGGPFEKVFARVMVTAGDCIQHYELFDGGDADRALARFEELCAGLEAAAAS
jgi:hypothetical protein